MKNFRRSVTTS